MKIDDYSDSVKIKDALWKGVDARITAMNECAETLPDTLWGLPVDFENSEIRPVDLGVLLSGALKAAEGDEAALTEEERATLDLFERSDWRAAHPSQEAGAS